MSYSDEDINKYDGSQFQQRTSFRNFDEISIQGEEGVFYRTSYDGAAKEWKREELKDEKLEVVFLRKRKRLAHFNPDDREEWMKTDEVNANSEMTTLRGGKIASTRATHDELRKAYDNLKTQEVFYSWYEGKIVKFVFKGTALGSKDGIPGQTSFYDYLQGFSEKEKVWQFKTYIEPIEFTKGKGKGARKLFSITLSRGDKVEDALLNDSIKPAIMDIGKYFEAIDAGLKPPTGEEVKDEEIEVIDARGLENDTEKRTPPPF